MTVWRPGMLAVCVDDGPVKTLGGYGEVTNPQWVENIKRGRIYRVTHVVRGIHDPSFVGIGDINQQAGGWEVRFRPLNEDLPRAELIARIKACKPQSLPVTTPRVPDHADQDSSLRVGMELSGAPTTSAGGLTCPFETAGIHSGEAR